MGPPVVVPALMAAGSAKTCGAPFTTCLCNLTSPVTTPLLPSSQSVVYPGSKTLNGRPLDQRLIPDHCQPPRNTSVTVFAEPRDFFPRPTGNWYTQSAM